MDREAYLHLVSEIRYSKRLPDAKYLHKESLRSQSPALFGFLAIVAQAIKVSDDDWNIAKLHARDFKVSYLSYPAFYSESYPSLEQSIAVDLGLLTTKVTSYSDSKNPPILHRKELFIEPTNDCYDEFCSITREGEAAGLYETPFKIGFKDSWERLIKQKGYSLVNGRLVQVDVASDELSEDKIDRHLTAITRYELSSPFKCLAKHGYLNGNHSVFDYGCGKGDDLRELEAHGLNVGGWDPNFRPDTEQLESDIVNLGFVINVIENIDERIEAIQRAFALSKRLLVISAMIAGEATISKFAPYKDGILTSRNTFQRYYSQSELQDFIERTLEDDAIAVAPGIFYVFKDKLQEQEFLSNRHKRRQLWKQLTGDSDRKNVSAEMLFVTHKSLLDKFWMKCLELGRLPANDEFVCSSELREALGSHQKAFRILGQCVDTSDFARAQQMRKEDLLVYFALALFGKRKTYSDMPEAMKRDIRVFFDKYKSVIDEAKKLLFSLGDVSLINGLCNKAHEELPASHLNPGHSLIVHEKFVGLLPSALRIYVGCAAQLFGDLEDIDLVKIHITSGKVSFMNYEGFDSSPLPLLKERIKVKLRQQDVDFFEYTGCFTSPSLYWKSIYIDPSFPDYKKQVSFDHKLTAFSFVDSDREYGPHREELDRLLASEGKIIKGYRFYTA
ncbi:DNA phosphorothioation-associated putative methyltransferase [Pontibacterium sp. N1Y112]|uniref:DNA phosphorothioation-associated putative methyltransferase n=2 Tax=Pontibacterium sinense TaxID=2781979 RepID=A0A8J7KAA3_9GAMM|nr:DNA phosphorothioation-associated putative methyltransferase [Pontibacterium sinense]